MSWKRFYSAGRKVGFEEVQEGGEERGRIRCNVGLWRRRWSLAVRIVYCFERRRWRRRRRYNPRPAPIGLVETPKWRWWRGATNRKPGTPAQITMLIVVVELSAHIPLFASLSLCLHSFAKATNSGSCASHRCVPIRSFLLILFYYGSDKINSLMTIKYSIEISEIFFIWNGTICLCYFLNYL